jgi:hypothetical protein
VSPGLYSFASPAFDMTLGRTVKRATFALTYNGVPIGTHASEADAEAAIDRLSRFCNTSRRCFAVEETL